jgi:hypothetical protein
MGKKEDGDFINYVTDLKLFQGFFIKNFSFSRFFRSCLMSKDSKTFRRGRKSSRSVSSFAQRDKKQSPRVLRNRGTIPTT